MQQPQTTVEKQYTSHLDIRDREGFTRLGVEKNGNWHTDPRRLVFVLSRYKFVSKMLSGKRNVLEVGCGDAWPVRLVLQEVGKLHAIDIDPIFIEDALSQVTERWPFTAAVHDILSGPLPAQFDAAYSLDVIEHIASDHEDVFVRNVADSLLPHGVLIVGMPSLESQQYASPLSRAGHVNCKSGKDFKTLMERHFHNVFMFSMNDEVVHTGFYPMSQYLFALCTERR
jgi:2-polyprenyl-3-methyl-5-hydroxy-6-metoxy-1,4-benzoquinol methylase